MPSKLSLNHYEYMINRVLTHICQHAGEDLSLDELASLACFSKYHFLRIFKALVNETVGDFIRRIRIEKAAFFLLYHPDASITQIALDCGFSSSQNFAKAFKLYYRQTPRSFREHGARTPLDAYRNPGNMLRNPGNDTGAPYRYTDILAGHGVHLQADRTVAQQVTLEDHSDVTVAYLRKKANYTAEHISAACAELEAWARPRKLLVPQPPLLCVYWDHVAVTPTDKRRFDVCIPVDPNLTPAPPVHKHVLVGGKVAVYRARIKPQDFYAHWNRFLKFWFPTSGFIPDDRPCFERIHQAFGPTPRQGFQVEICVPIKPLSKS